MICKRCKKDKPPKDFPMVRIKRMLSNGEIKHWEGKRRICGHCKYLQDKEKRDQDKFRQHQKSYRLEHRDDLRNYDKAYRIANQDILREKAKIRNERNRDHLQAYRKTWRKNNPEKMRAARVRYRALKRNALGSFDCDDIRKLYEKQKGLCVYCRCSLKNDYQVDHFIALSNGGTNKASNIQLTCGTCNHMKRARDPYEFVQTEFARLF